MQRYFLAEASMGTGVDSLVPPVDQHLAETALGSLATLCRARGRRFSELRCRLLSALWESDQPLGAYALLTHLNLAPDRKVTAATVYRALAFLLKHGFAARIESRNAYVPCAHAGHSRVHMFFMCAQCGIAFEVEDPSIDPLLMRDAEVAGFEVHRGALELHGLCARCLATR